MEPRCDFFGDEIAVGDTVLMAEPGAGAINYRLAKVIEFLPKRIRIESLTSKRRRWIPDTGKMGEPEFVRWLATGRHLVKIEESMVVKKLMREGN